MVRGIASAYKRTSVGVRASLWFTVCNLAQKGVLFLTTPFFTRIMTSEEFGKYSAFMSWQEIVSIFATLNLSFQVFNNGMIKFKKDKDGYATSMIGLIVSSCISLFVVLFIFQERWKSLTGLDEVSMILMIMYSLSSGIIGIWTIRNKYDFNYRPIVLLTISMVILNPVLGLLFVKNFENKVMVRVISSVIVIGLFAIISLIFILKKNRKIINLKYWKYALRMDLPLIPHFLAVVMLNSSDRIMISVLAGDIFTARYTIAYNVATVMQIIVNSVYGSLNPWIYHRMEEGAYDHIYKNMNKIIFLVWFLCLAPMFFAREAVMILGGEQYIEATHLVPVVSASIMIIFNYSFFITIEMFYEKNMYTAVGTFISALINIVLNYIFIPLYGYSVAAYTTLVSYLVLFYFHFFIFNRIIRSKKVDIKIINFRRMNISIITIIVIAQFLNLLTDMFLIRMGILCLALSLFVLNFNRFKKYMKGINE